MAPKRCNKQARWQAAIEHMSMRGFQKEAVIPHIKDLIEVYGKDGWSFIESNSYQVLKEAILEAHSRELGAAEETQNGQSSEEPTMGFNVGDLVEVCSKEDGYKGSYFLASIVTKFSDDSFAVEYENLVTDDERHKLIEMVMGGELRPVPPETRTSSFKLFDRVDAFDLDGWWEGIISGVTNNGEYYVYFYYSQVERQYPFSRLRVHKEFEGGVGFLLEKWVVDVTCFELMVFDKNEWCLIDASFSV